MNKALLRSELKRDESERFKPYKCSAGKTTIGIGRNLDDVGISPDESAYLFANDVARAENDVRMFFLGFDAMTDARQRALVNMMFNLGVTRFSEFKKMIHAVNACDWNEAANQALDSKWSRQVGERSVRIASLLRQGV